MRKISLKKHRQSTKSVRGDIWHTVADASKLWYRLAEKQLSFHGITTSELRVLRFLSQIGASPMVTLARDQQMTPGGMTGIIDHLEDAGLLQRVRSESDRRVINIEITKEGRHVVERAMSVYRRFVEKSLEDLSEEEINSFLRILNKMISSAQSSKH